MAGELGATVSASASAVRATPATASAPAALERFAMSSAFGPTASPTARPMPAACCATCSGMRPSRPPSPASLFVSDMTPPIVRVQAQRALSAGGCITPDKSGRAIKCPSAVASHGAGEFFRQERCVLRNLNHGPYGNAVGVPALNGLIYKEKSHEQHVRQGQGYGEPGGRQGEAGRRRSNRRSGAQGRGQGAGRQGRSAEGRRQRQVSHQEGGRPLIVAAEDSH